MFVYGEGGGGDKDGVLGSTYICTREAVEDNIRHRAGGNLLVINSLEVVDVERASRTEFQLPHTYSTNKRKS